MSFRQDILPAKCLSTRCLSARCPSTAENIDYTSENSSEIFQDVSDIIYPQKRD